MKSLTTTPLSRRALLRNSAFVAAAPFVTSGSSAARPLLRRQADDDVVSLDVDHVLSDSEARAIYSVDGVGLTGSRGRYRQHLMFYYDEGLNTLINPRNVTPDPAIAGTRGLSVTLRSFHASLENDIWDDVEEDLQLQLSVHVPGQEGTLSWILLTMMNVVLEGDDQGHKDFVQSFQEVLSPTAELRPGAEIEIAEHRLEFQLQLSGQRKRSIWRRLFGFAEDAVAAFTTLTIPKLVTQGLGFARDAMGVFEQESSLIPILRSGALPCRISDEASGGDFTLRPGYWVAIDRAYAEPKMDEATGDLTGHLIDIPRQFYGVVDSNGRIDADYLVIQLGFPASSA